MVMLVTQLMSLLEGSVLIEGNTIQKGPLSDNTTTAICVGYEGGTNPGEDIIVRNNKFINNTSRNIVFVKNLTSNKEKFENNIFEGGKTILVKNAYPN